MADYIRDLRLAKWDLGVGLHGSNPKRSMSALGQKQTFPNVQPMSALPPKADISGAHWDVCFVPKAEVEYLTRGQGLYGVRPFTSASTQLTLLLEVAALVSAARRRGRSARAALACSALRAGRWTGRCAIKQLTFLSRRRPRRSAFA